MSLPDVSLVVPVHAKSERLALTLAGLEGLHGRERVELILVADGPTAPVRALLAAQRWGRVVATPEGGLGRAGARNAGARDARAPLLVFLDDDILVQADFIDRHLEAQTRAPGLVHGRLRELLPLLRVTDPGVPGPHGPVIDVSALRAGRWSPPDGMRQRAAALSQAIEHPEATTEWPWLAAGANLSLPRAAWAAVGGFDEGYGRRWGMEDIDFAYRLWRAGVPVQLSTAAAGFHQSHAEAGRWADHAANLHRFQVLAPEPAAQALDSLLAPYGSVKAYRSHIDQIRCRASAEASAPSVAEPAATPANAANC